MKNKLYNSLDVAQLMRAIAFEKHGIELTVTQTQKLLYMLYGYYLSTYNKKIIDESPRAWPFGPVFPLTRALINYNEIPNIQDIISEFKDDTTLNLILYNLIKKLGRTSGKGLTEWSQEAGGAWDLTRKSWGFKWNDIIPDKKIKNYFDKYKLNFE